MIKAKCKMEKMKIPLRFPDFVAVPGFGCYDKVKEKVGRAALPTQIKAGK